MKRLFVLLFIALSIPAFAVVDSIPFVGPTGASQKAAVDSAGQIKIADAKVLPFTTYIGNIVPNVYKTLGSLASFTTGDFVVIRAVNGRIFQVGSNTVSTATALLCNFIDNGEQIGFTVGNGTTGTWANSAFITQTNPASIAIQVWPTTK